MNGILSLPVLVRLGFVFILALLLPAAFLALCAPVARQAQPPARPSTLRLAVALFIPLFFLSAGLGAELLRVHFPHIYAIP